MASPLPPGADGNDAAQLVFGGCAFQNRVKLAGGIGLYGVANGIAAGGVGILVGFGVTWMIARALRGKKVI